LFGQILVEFLFRLTFGVAAAMGVTPSSQVTSGFYRIHLWVLMGLQTLAVLAVGSSQSTFSPHGKTIVWQFYLAVAAAAVCYFGAAIWMYERRLPGKIAIWLVAGLALAGCTVPLLETATKPVAFQYADRVTSGLLLGLVTTAMLLGHWYLNTPTMKLEPLRRLLNLLGAAILARTLVSAGGLFGHINDVGENAITLSWLLFYLLRLLAGLAGLMLVVIMAAKTLKIPNTQSATGILYAGVILAFIGELTSQLLSAEAMFPL